MKLTETRTGMFDINRTSCMYQSVRKINVIHEWFRKQSVPPAHLYSNPYVLNTPSMHALTCARRTHTEARTEPEGYLAKPDRLPVNFKF